MTDAERTFAELTVNTRMAIIEGLQAAVCYSPSEVTARDAYAAMETLGYPQSAQAAQRIRERAHTRASA